MYYAFAFLFRNENAVNMGIRQWAGQVVSTSVMVTTPPTRFYGSLTWSSVALHSRGDRSVMSQNAL